MAVFTDINRDKHGVVRGRCKDCPENCPQYSQPVLRHSCTYCGCPAGHHERVEPRPELIIKREPEEEAESSERRPTPGPSRRPDDWPTIKAHPGPSRLTRSTGFSTEHQGPRAIDRTPRTYQEQSRTVIQKRCKTLFEYKGVEYSQLGRHLSKTDHGVFTVLCKGKIIYVGDPKKTRILSSLRSIFDVGNGQDISKFVKTLSNDFKSAHVRIAWLKHMDDDPHLQTCKEGKKVKSYRQCLSKVQGSNPRDILKIEMGEI